MYHPWQADHEIDPITATRLIEAQFPQLMPLTLRLFAEGWDNRAFLVNDRFIFRFPRRNIAVDLLRTEMGVLGELFHHLPLAIPNPVFKGQPNEAFPWPFAGYEMLPGQSACKANLLMAERRRCAVPLARFLASLHGLAPSEALCRQLPGDTLRRCQIDRLKEKIRNNAEDLSGQLGPQILDHIRRSLSRSFHYEPRTNVLVHGDLYVRHLLVSGEREICGVIDWGDVHLGDPGLDLSIAWSFLPPDSHTTFRNAYGAIQETTWTFARLRALHYGLVLKKYGQHLEDADLVREADYILDFQMAAASH